MKTLYSAELWNCGSFESRYITPMGLFEDLPCVDENYLWSSKEEAHRSILEEAKTWHDPSGVQVVINEHELGGE
jgi:hypothetical protein